MPYLRRFQASILNLIKQERQLILTLKLEIMKKLVLAASLFSRSLTKPTI